jgi:hypothetical protein
MVGGLDLKRTEGSWMRRWEAGFERSVPERMGQAAGVIFPGRASAPKDQEQGRIRTAIVLTLIGLKGPLERR